MMGININTLQEAYHSCQHIVIMSQVILDMHLEVARQCVMCDLCDLNRQVSCDASLACIS